MLKLSNSTPSVDATVTLNTTFGWSFGQDVTNTIEHEITEGAMGRVGGLGDNANGWSTMDLFRYDSSGVLDTTDGRDGNMTFFSINGGSTLSSLAWNNEFNAKGTRANSEDTSDFTQQDVFGTGSPGETNTFSATDLDVMDVLGWIPSSPHVAPTLLTPNHVLWENTSISGLAMQELVVNPSGDSVSEYAFRDLGSNGQFTLNGTPEQSGQWAIVDAASLGSVVYRAGANPGTDSIQESVYDADLAKWVSYSTFSMTTTVEPVVNLKNFGVQEGKSLAIAPITSVSNPSGDTITEYALMDAGTNGHFVVDAAVGPGTTAEANSSWFFVNDLASVHYVAGNTTGTDPIEIEAYDATTRHWTAVGSATATTMLPIILPPGGTGPLPSPVNALAVMAPTSSAATAAPVTSTVADTLVANFGNATLVAGPGNDTFVIGSGGGQETIQNFDPAHDTLQFSVSLFASYAAAMTDARQVGAGTVFAIDAHDSVTLQNVNVGSLTASNVHVG